MKQKVKNLLLFTTMLLATCRVSAYDFTVDGIYIMWCR